jgi:hypothetical protein
MAIALAVQCASLLAVFLLITAIPVMAEQLAAPEGIGQSTPDSSRSATACQISTSGSPYIPVDSWVYPAILRLYSMGYVDHIYLGMRPWTRASLARVLEGTEAEIKDADDYGDPTVSEAQGIYAALLHFLNFDTGLQCATHEKDFQIESVYTATRGISGTPLRDSFHLGSTVINDYGRVYQNGFNNYSGASGYARAGRFTLYVRGEFQGAPAAAGYAPALGRVLSTVDGTAFSNPAGAPYSQATIPMGPIATTTLGRFIEAYVSAHLVNHEISLGKQDDWLGPGLGGGMAYSNNAENIYSFRINRIEPLEVPLVSRFTGPFRYEFLIGKLRGHTFMPNPAYVANPSPNLPNVINPGDPWVHLEKISFRPTENLEFGFERTAIWGGKGHGPITVNTFLKSFFSFASPGGNDKNGPNDPGARFGSFDFSYRLPLFRNWLMVYADSEVHDDVSPIDAPRRSSWRPGLYLSHVPGIPKLDIRAEAATTDPSSSNVASQDGHFMYWETIQRQGYTNQGQLFGDWIGREEKGGQGWVSYHLSGNEQLQVGIRNQKATTWFIPGGTTLNEINFQVVKRIGKDLEINGKFAVERWSAPIYLAGQHTVTATTIQMTWFPEKRGNR